ncbi:aldo/keto reductase [Sphingobacterium corticis]|uniref:Aldo/keto reductase n=1 Tax=Sphingobacterium corticis TaxID=1812823 RepID=A0ABW5NMI9_9SPHI
MSDIKRVKLGSQGLEVPAVGLGCMGMTVGFGCNIYGDADEREAISAIHRSLELGGNFLDTAESYGPFLNEQLIAKAIKGNRHDYQIATKFGIEVTNQGEYTGANNGRKAYVKKAAERSLKNLGTDYIDLYYLHRLDPNTPIEETTEAMAELVNEGKIRYIGISEVGSETIRRAHAIHPLTAIQSEYSLFEREIERLGILSTMEELGIGLVAYSPIGRGLMSGNIQQSSDLASDDCRWDIPKYQGDYFTENIRLVNEIKALAIEKNITTAQLAIAWVIAKGHVPIPGTKRVKYAAENLAAADIQLSEQDLARLEAIVPLNADTGERYDAESMKGVNI